MKKTNQLAVQIENQIQTSGVELNEAQRIASFYAPFMNEAQEQAELLKSLELGNLEHVEQAKRIRLDLSKICSNLAKQKKEDKELILIKGRFIDGLFNAVEGFARLTQKDAEEIEKHAEKLEEIRLNGLESERKAELLKYDVDVESINVRTMTDDVFTFYLDGCKKRFEEKQEAERLAEIERAANEKKRELFLERQTILLPFSAYAPVYELTEDVNADEFAEILASCEKLKADSIEKQRLQAEENERLKAEKEALEAEQAKSRLEAAEQAEREKTEREALELKLKNEKIAREAAESAEKQRASDEAAKKRALEKGSDVFRMKSVLDSCTLEQPSIKDKALQETWKTIDEKFQSFKIWANSQIEKTN